MKVLSIALLLVGVVTARSGPYLPSGWRPAGPAFLLPTEIKDPSPIPRNSGDEASGSDFLREYGPPQFQLSEVSQDLETQDLPNEVTEQPFFILRANVLEEEVEKGGKDTEVIVVSEDKFIAADSPTSGEETTTVSLDTRGRSLDVNAEVEAEVEVKEDVKDATEITVDNYKEQEAKDTTQLLGENEVTTEINEESTQKIAEENGNILINSIVKEDAFIVKIVEDKEDYLTQSDLKSDTVINTETKADTLSKVNSDTAETNVGTSEVAEDNTSTSILSITEQKVLDEEGSEIANSSVVTKVEEKLENEVQAVEKKGETEVNAVQNAKNIEETLVNLENEVKAQQIQAINDLTGIKTIADDSGNVDAKGFLEYGPPGFTEYGPPKASDVLRSPASNEVRRRRFSPKFILIQRRRN